LEFDERTVARQYDVVDSGCDIGQRCACALVAKRLTDTDALNDQIRLRPVAAQ
jgi:hypothetical protein